MFFPNIKLTIDTSNIKTPYTCLYLLVFLASRW